MLARMEDQKVLDELCEWLEWEKNLNCRGMTPGEMLDHVDEADRFHDGYPLLSQGRLRELKERMASN
jgi:hypothetical protein